MTNVNPVALGEVIDIFVYSENRAGAGSLNGQRQGSEYR